MIVVGFYTIHLAKNTDANNWDVDGNANLSTHETNL